MKSKRFTKKQKKMMTRIAISIILLITLTILHRFISPPSWLSVCLYLIPFLIAGYDVVIKAFKNLINGNMLDENFLMSIATLGAFCIGEYSEGSAVMLFYQVGELFQNIATASSRKSIAKLMDIKPDVAYVERDGSVVEADPNEVEIGEIIVIKPGEKVPIDCEVIDGRSSLNTSALTGESLPREIEIGSEALSGCINLTGIIRCRTTKKFGESTVSKVLELVENASSKKAKTENFITKFAKYYTPIVVCSAIALAVIPPLVIGFSKAEFIKWLTRGLNFLVVSCPCALVISVPMSFFGGIGRASKEGILVKGGNYLELLSDINTIAFDKTGTLTKGSFSVSNVTVCGSYNQDELLRLTAAAEKGSNHPIAISLQQYNDNSQAINDYEEISGKGIRCTINSDIILCGNCELMQKYNITYPEIEINGTAIYVAKNQEFLGIIEISDTLKENSQDAISQLKKTNIQTVILTGDNEKAAQRIAEQLQIDKCYASLLPAEKVEKVETLISENKGTKHGCVAFVGDGINDAPVLSRADLAIAMGACGSDAAIEAADIVLMDDNPAKLCKAIKIAKKTMSIVYENIGFALGVKLIILLTSALGITNMWIAVFGDVGVAILAILNSMRALYSDVS